MEVKRIITNVISLPTIHADDESLSAIAGNVGNDQWQMDFTVTTPDGETPLEFMDSKTPLGNFAAGQLLLVLWLGIKKAWLDPAEGDDDVQHGSHGHDGDDDDDDPDDDPFDYGGWDDDDDSDLSSLMPNYPRGW